MLADLVGLKDKEIDSAVRMVELSLRKTIECEDNPTETLHKFNTYIHYVKHTGIYKNELVHLYAQKFPLKCFEGVSNLNQLDQSSTSKNFENQQKIANAASPKPSNHLKQAKRES
jgi:hypothetical protein